MIHIGDMSVSEKRELLQTLDVIFGHDRSILEYQYAHVIKKLEHDIKITDELLISVKAGFGLDILYKMWDRTIQEAISIDTCFTLDDRRENEYFRSMHRIIPRAIIRDDKHFVFLRLTDSNANKQPGRLTLTGGHMTVGDINETLFDACKRTVEREILEELDSFVLSKDIAAHRLITHRTLKDFVYIDDEPVSCRNFGVIFDIHIRSVQDIRSKEPEKHTIQLVPIYLIHQYLHEVDPWFRKAIQLKPYMKDIYLNKLSQLSDQM